MLCDFAMQNGLELIVAGNNHQATQRDIFRMHFNIAIIGQGDGHRQIDRHTGVDTVVVDHSFIIFYLSNELSGLSCCYKRLFSVQKSR